MRGNPLDNIEISIFPFKFKHFNDLIELHKLNNYQHTAAITMKRLPKIGYISYFGDSPIAAGFLRRVEGGYAQMDTLVSNPHFGSQIRHLAIDKVVKSLIDDAKTLDLEGIVAFTSDIGVLKRAEDIGFNRLDAQKLIALPLRS